jgi:hypothetical protein
MSGWESEYEALQKQPTVTYLPDTDFIPVYSYNLTLCGLHTCTPTHTHTHTHTHTYTHTHTHMHTHTLCAFSQLPSAFVFFHAVLVTIIKCLRQLAYKEKSFTLTYRFRVSGPWSHRPIAFRLLRPHSNGREHVSRTKPSISRPESKEVGQEGAEVPQVPQGFIVNSPKSSH